MGSSTVDRDLGLKRFMHQMDVAQGSAVYIGIHSDAYNDGKSVAEYGAENEYGTSKHPERSFMRSSFDENRANISRDLSERFDEIKAGKTTSASALKKVGDRHARQIKLKIKSNIPPPNAPLTIKLKNSDRTLIDTRAMLNSVRAEVKIR